MTGSSNSLFVDGNGNVGIGTTLPNTALHVRTNTNTTPGTIIDQVGTGALLDIRDAGVSKVIVDGNGNVGIGQAVPVSKLVVDGSMSIGYPSTAAPTNNLIVSGYVGIGTALPLEPLHIKYISVIDADTSFLRFAGSGGFNYIQSGTSLTGNSKADLIFTSIYGQTEWMRIKGSTGYVGIGVANPSCPLDVVGYANLYLNSGYYFNTSGGISYTGANYQAISIKGQQYIWATVGFIASSDARIKTNIQDINDETALNQLRLLQPKTYEYIDKVQKGQNTVNGFIAQEVAEVLPYAVTKQKEIIPSIYAIASVMDGVLTLDKAHDLSVGDKVKLIKEHVAVGSELREGGELITTVKEVINAYSFTIEDTIDDKRIFVYGKEVPDFHTLDKNAIFTIGVAAVQELDRQIQDLKLRFASFEERLVALERLNN